MSAYPDRDCAHMLGEYTPIVIAEKVVGSKLINWCCELNGDQSCGTADCLADRGRYAYSSAGNVDLLERKYA